jgi:hypothetical protein
VRWTSYEKFYEVCCECRVTPVLSKIKYFDNDFQCRLPEWNSIDIHLIVSDFERMEQLRVRRTHWSRIWFNKHIFHYTVIKVGKQNGMIFVQTSSFLVLKTPLKIVHGLKSVICFDFGKFNKNWIAFLSAIGKIISWNKCFIIYFNVTIPKNCVYIVQWMYSGIKYSLVKELFLYILKNYAFDIVSYVNCC